MDDRRTFLLQCGLAVATAGLGTKFLLGAGQAASTPSAPLAGMTRDRFEALVNQWLSFHDRLASRGMVARLTEVRDHARTANLEQFSLRFRARPGGHVPEGVYRVATGAAERFDLFIIPTGGDERGPEYRADFSLLA